MSNGNTTSTSPASSSVPFVITSSTNSPNSTPPPAPLTTFSTSTTSDASRSATSSPHPPVVTSSVDPVTPVIIVTPSIYVQTSNGVTSTIVLTITATHGVVPTGSATGSASVPTTISGSLVSNDTSSHTGLDDGGKIAIAVVVPIAAVALLVLAGIYLWRKHKQKRDTEEQRRKEVEEYGYNPNADPTIPAVAVSGAPYDVKEDVPSGYRGWGSTTLAGSSRGKVSTTISGGAAGAAYSNATSPTGANQSDTRSVEHPMNAGSHSPEAKMAGAMGPFTADHRGSNVHRGPSSASSYSATTHSDGSGDGTIGVAISGEPGSHNQYGHGNPYTDLTAHRRQGPAEVNGQAVIRDVAARRNTRIENPAHFPQQSAGMSQNF